MTDTMDIEELDHEGGYDDDDDDPLAYEEAMPAMQYPPPLRPCSKRMMLRGDDLNRKNPNLQVHREGEEADDAAVLHVDPQTPQVNITAAVLRDEIRFRHDQLDDWMEHKRLKAAKVVVEDKADALAALQRDTGNNEATAGNMELPIVDFAMHHPSVIYQPSNIRRADKEKNKSYKKTREDRDKFAEYAAEKELKEKMDEQIRREEEAMRKKGEKMTKKKPETNEQRIGEAARLVRDRKRREEKILKAFKERERKKMSVDVPSKREQELADKALEFGLSKLEDMEQYELGTLKIKRDADTAEANRAALAKYKKDVVRRKREARGVLNNLEQVDSELAGLGDLTLSNLIKRYKILGSRIKKRLWKAALKKKKRMWRKWRRTCKLTYMYYIWAISHSEMLTDWNTIFENWYAKMMKKRAAARSNRLMMRQLKRDQREEAYVNWKETRYAEAARIKREAEEAKFEEMRQNKAKEKARKKQEKMAKDIAERKRKKEALDKKKAEKAAREEAALLSGAPVDVDDDNSIASGGSLEVDDVGSVGSGDGTGVEDPSSFASSMELEGSFGSLDDGDSLDGDGSLGSLEDGESIDGLSLQPQLGLKEGFGGDDGEARELSEKEAEAERRLRRRRRPVKPKKPYKPGYLVKAGAELKRQAWEHAPGPVFMREFARRKKLKAKKALAETKKKYVPKNSAEVKAAAARRLKKITPTAETFKPGGTLHHKAITGAVVGAPKAAVKGTKRAILSCFPAYHDVRYELESTPRHTGKYSRQFKNEMTSDAVSKLNVWVSDRLVLVKLVLYILFSEDGPLGYKNLKRIAIATAFATWRAMPTREQVKFLLSKEGPGYVVNAAKTKVSDTCEVTKDITLDAIDDMSYAVTDGMDYAKTSTAATAAAVKAAPGRAASRLREKFQKIKSVDVKLNGLSGKGAKVGNFTDGEGEGGGSEGGEGGVEAPPADSYDPVQDLSNEGEGATTGNEGGAQEAADAADDAPKEAEEQTLPPEKPHVVEP